MGWIQRMALISTRLQLGCFHMAESDHAGTDLTKANPVMWSLEIWWLGVSDSFIYNCSLTAKFVCPWAGLHGTVGWEVSTPALHDQLGLTFLMRTN